MDALFMKSAQVVIGQIIIAFADYEFSWGFEDEGTLLNVLTLKIPNVGSDTIAEIKKADSLVFSFGYNDNIGAFLTGRIVSVEEGRVGINSYLKIKAQQYSGSVDVFISKSFNAGTRASAVIKDLCNLGGLKIRQLDLALDIKYLTGTQRYGNVLKELQKVVTACGSTMSIKGSEIYIFKKDSKKTSQVIHLNFSSGLLDEPTKCVDKDKKYDYMIRAVALPEIDAGTIVYVEGESLKTYGVVKELAINDFIAKYYIGVI